MYPLCCRPDNEHLKVCSCWIKNVSLWKHETKDGGWTRITGGKNTYCRCESGPSQSKRETLMCFWSCCSLQISRGSLKKCISGPREGQWRKDTSRLGERMLETSLADEVPMPSAGRGSEPAGQRWSELYPWELVPGGEHWGNTEIWWVEDRGSEDYNKKTAKMEGVVRIIMGWACGLWKIQLLFLAFVCWPFFSFSFFSPFFVSTPRKESRKRTSSLQESGLSWFREAKPEGTELI